MKAHITLNIADIDALVHEAAAKKGIELTGYTIKSHTRQVLYVAGDMLIDPNFTHRIEPTHKELTP